MAGSATESSMLGTATQNPSIDFLRGLAYRWRRWRGQKFRWLDREATICSELMLTYMSISGHISSVGPAILRPFSPVSRKLPRRRLFLTAQAQKDFDDPHSAVNSLVGKGYVEAAMTRWVLGERLYGTNKRGTFLDRLEKPPPEIWEIRVTEPIAQGRLFGRLAERDTLILTNFHTRGFLGKKGSHGWRTALDTCVSQWNGAFGIIPPLTGSIIDEYVSENFDNFPLA